MPCAARINRCAAFPIDLPDNPYVYLCHTHRRINVTQVANAQFFLIWNAFAEARWHVPATTPSTKEFHHCIIMASIVVTYQINMVTLSYQYHSIGLELRVLLQNFFYCFEDVRVCINCLTPISRGVFDSRAASIASCLPMTGIFTSVISSMK